MLRRLKGRWWCLAFLFALGAAEPAPSLEQTETRGEAVARAVVDRGAVELSGDVAVTVSVEGKAPLEIEPLKTITTARTWVVLPAAAPQTVMLPKGRMRWQQAFRLTPLQDGKVELPLEPLVFRAGGGSAESVRWRPFTVQVNSVVSSTTLSALKDIAPPEAVPPAPVFPWLVVSLAVSAPLVLLLVGWGAWRIGRRPAPPPRELTPAEQARHDLGQLAADDPRFPERLADVLRRYLNGRFAVQTAERTTAELIAALEKQNCLSAEQLALLRALLERCDLAKFARAGFAAPDAVKTVQQAQDFVMQTAPTS